MKNHSPVTLLGCFFLLLCASFEITHEDGGSLKIHHETYTLEDGVYDTNTLAIVVYLSAIHNGQAPDDESIDADLLRVLLLLGKLHYKHWRLRDASGKANTKRVIDHGRKALNAFQAATEQYKDMKMVIELEGDLLAIHGPIVHDLSLHQSKLLTEFAELYYMNWLDWLNGLDAVRTYQMLRAAKLWGKLCCYIINKHQGTSFEDHVTSNLEGSYELHQLEARAVTAYAEIKMGTLLVKMYERLVNGYGSQETEDVLFGFDSLDQLLHESIELFKETPSSAIYDIHLLSPEESSLVKRQFHYMRAECQAFHHGGLAQAYLSNWEDALTDLQQSIDCSEEYIVYEYESGKDEMALALANDMVEAAHDTLKISMRLSGKIEVACTMYDKYLSAKVLIKHLSSTKAEDASKVDRLSKADKSRPDFQDLVRHVDMNDEAIAKSLVASEITVPIYREYVRQYDKDIFDPEEMNHEEFISVLYALNELYVDPKTQAIYDDSTTRHMFECASYCMCITYYLQKLGQYENSYPFFHVGMNYFVTAIENSYNPKPNFLAGRVPFPVELNPLANFKLTGRLKIPAEVLSFFTFGPPKEEKPPQPKQKRSEVKDELVNYWPHLIVDDYWQDNHTSFEL